MTRLRPMISYAQNGEDVVLRRAFRDQESGFYVDVGACDPVDDSVTHHFHAAGWRGINIEPDPHWFGKLSAARSRDINIHAAVGDGDGTVPFFAVPVRGHGTLDPELAGRRDAGAACPVPQMRLTDIATSHAAGLTIDFLKIDVEGWEAQVLASLDLRRIRPRVILVEAVDQDGRPTHAAWEADLLAQRYRFALFDGLNRFYCREEDAETLLPRLAAPANVLDNFRLAREVQAEAKLARQIEECAEAKAELRSVQQAAATAHAAERELEAKLARQIEECAEAKADVRSLQQTAAAAHAAERELRLALEREAAAHVACKSELEAKLAHQIEECAEAKADARSLQQAAATAHAEERELRLALEREAAAHVACKSKLDQVYASNSWRLTEPLRNAKRMLRLFRRQTGHG